VRTGELSMSSGGVRGSGEASKPGGLVVGETLIMDSGVSNASAMTAAPVEGTCGESTITSCPASAEGKLSSSCPQLLAVGEVGMNDVGEAGGSGVTG
jgi:hypothetical protein